MSETPETSKPFEVNGKTYEIVSIETLTFREQRKLKRLSGGMTPATLGEALGEGDPEAIYAILTVSMQRADSKIADDFLDDFNFSDVLATLPSDDDDEDEKKPERPTEPPASDEPTSES